MLKFEKLCCCHEARLLQVVLHQYQIRFAATAEDFILSNEPDIHKYVALLDDDLIGFFKIDLGYARSYDFCPDSALGLRALVLNSRHQGRGLGTILMGELLGFLGETYQQFDSVYLTVNCKNPGAIRCYQKAGLVDTGVLYLGGSQGPQHVMSAQIRPS